MFANSLVVLYRSLARHPLYAALNLLGLAAGIAVFLVLSLVVRYEAGYNRWLPHADQTYRMDSTFYNLGQAPAEYDGVSFAIMPFLRQDFPQIADASRALNRDGGVSVGASLDKEQVTYVDPSFLNVVELPLVAGDRAHALANPAQVVISEAIARKYFGTIQAVGLTLGINLNGVKHSYIVSAVMRDLPGDSTMKIDMLALITPEVAQGIWAFTSWDSLSGTIFLRLRSKADAAAVSAGLGDFVRRRWPGLGDGSPRQDPTSLFVLSLVALPAAHFHDVGIGTQVPGVDRRVVWSLGAVGLMALLTAAINYVNLATARAGLRAREVAVRKVMGATHGMLMAQFLAEAIAVVALAAVIGLAATELALPVVNALGGWDVKIDYATVAPELILLSLVVGLGAGCYPAVLLASYQPAVVLASARSPAGGRMGTRLRNLLVLLQFASAIGFAICTLVIDAQARLLQTADRGFERQGLIIVDSLGDRALKTRQLALLQALAQVPGVVAATISDREPNSDETNNRDARRPGLTGAAPDLLTEDVGDNYLATYGVSLIAGRWFDGAHQQDDIKGASGKGGSFNVVINRTAVRVLGFADPDAALGQGFSSSLAGIDHFTIVGVVQDVRFKSPRNPSTPQFYLHDSTPIDAGEGAIRFSGVPQAEMMQRLQAAWRAAAPQVPFSAKSADERLADYYQPDQDRARLFSAGAILAVVIACVGLYGLASFNTARRVKEIGIRKVLGASTAKVLALLIGQFVQPVLIANLIAWPVAWIAMRSWLAGFDQRISLSPLYFLAAGGVALLIAVLTVTGQALRVAYAEPGKALRYE